jgi:hypothetical protein
MEEEEKTQSKISESESKKKMVISDSTFDPLPIDITDSTNIKLYSFELEVFYTLAYCGGAAPNEEILHDLKTPKKLTDSELLLIETTTKEKFIFKTNGKSLKIPEGEYDLFLTKNINRDEAFHFNPDCEMLVAKSIHKFKVKNSVHEYITIHFDCDPCDPSMKMRP